MYMDDIQHTIDINRISAREFDKRLQLYKFHKTNDSGTFLNCIGVTVVGFNLVLLCCCCSMYQHIDARLNE